MRSAGRTRHRYSRARTPRCASPPGSSTKREALFALGLWGVPSYCLRDRCGAVVFSTWGQDRLWLVGAEIRRLAPE
jgi:2-hydroxychromene-2-carboxylate isomerase